MMTIHGKSLMFWYLTPCSFSRIIVKRLILQETICSKSSFLSNQIKFNAIKKAVEIILLPYLLLFFESTCFGDTAHQH